jgi:tetratricopeptide (TPR) repeat protein
VPALSPRGIFLGYRPEDTGAYAHLLQRELGKRIPDARIVMDLAPAAARPGILQDIQEALDSCGVLVALIGRGWVSAVDEVGRRCLDNPDDVMRRAVQASLEQGVRVIPVLVDGARPLRDEDLPPEMRQLARLHALELSYGQFDYDAGRLAEVVERVLIGAPDTGADQQPPAGDTEERRAGGQAGLEALYLAMMMEARGDLAGARVVLQRAIDTGPADIVAAAARNLGIMLEKRGDVAGAREAYQRAIDSRDPEGAPVAAISLGDLLKAQGDVTGALVTYQQAINSGHADYAPAAAVALGDLRKQQGDAEGARAAYQQAFISGHADHAQAGAVGLRNLLKAQADLKAARAAYQATPPGPAGAGPAAATPAARRDADRRIGEEARALPVGQMVHAVAFSPDGTLLATGSKSRVTVWDLRTGAVAWKRRITPLTETARVYSVAFSPDGTWVATGAHKSAEVWDATTGELRKMITHTSLVLAVAFSPEGTRLAGGCSDRTAQIWNAATGLDELTVKHAYRMTAAPLLQDWVRAVAFSPDGARLATGGSDKTARVWNIAAG